MKPQKTKKPFAFIIAVLMFSILPLLADAQNKFDDKSSEYKLRGGWCNCKKRPIPFGCGQICGWKTTTITNNPGSQTTTISFSLQQAEKLSVKIFDMTGRLVTTLEDKIFEPGEHKLQWNAAAVHAGIYIVQINSGSYI